MHGCVFSITWYLCGDLKGKAISQNETSGSPKCFAILGHQMSSTLFAGAIATCGLNRLNPTRRVAANLDRATFRPKMPAEGLLYS